MYLFDNLDEVREITDNFIYDYNNHRPHDALKGLPPAVYRARWQQSDPDVSDGLRSASATPSLHYAHQKTIIPRKYSTFKLY